MTKNKDIEIPEVFVEPLFSPYRNKVFYGGRGAAKSRSIVRALLMLAASQHERVLCTREFQTSIKDSVKRLLDDEIVRMGLQDYYRSTRTELYCPATGSLFLFAGLHHNVDSIKSMEGITKCWIEEAHVVSQSSLDTLVPTIRQDGSELWWSYNPKMKNDPVHSLFVLNKPPPNSFVKKVGFDDNPWFPDVLRQEMEWDRDHNPDKYQHVWLGNPLVNSEKQIFYGCWKVEPVPRDIKGELYYGADWGFSQDPTTVNRMWIDGKKLYLDYEANKTGVEIDKLPELFKQVPGASRHKIIADNARPETISYMNNHGFRVSASKKGKGSIEDGIEHIRQYEVIIDPRCKKTIDEFSLYSFKEDKRTGEITNKIEDKNNHHIDSIRYALERVRKNKRKVLI